MRVRRHITQAQLALATAAVYNWFPADGSAQKMNTFEGEDVTSTPPQKYSEKSNSDLSSLAGVSVPEISWAKAVRSKAVPEVQAAMIS